MESTPGLTNHATKENGRTTSSTVKVSISGAMVANILETLKTTSSTVKAFFLLPTAGTTRASSRTMRSMEKAFSSGLMVNLFKGNGSRENKKERVFTLMKKVSVKILID